MENCRISHTSISVLTGLPSFVLVTVTVRSRTCVRASKGSPSVPHWTYSLPPSAVSPSQTSRYSSLFVTRVPSHRSYGWAHSRTIKPPERTASFAPPTALIASSLDSICCNVPIIMSAMSTGFSPSASTYDLMSPCSSRSGTPFCFARSAAKSSICWLRSTPRHATPAAASSRMCLPVPHPKSRTEVSSCPPVLVLNRSFRNPASSTKSR
mmetsp:Transcript_16339/g.45537  ORF Transcript_16339/g.45537 Transcript_16339/m.45537 type:complete len:210 (+) Transcript_16339:239-868(+)